MEEVICEPIHFVLIHGAGQGAHFWFKVKSRLKVAGHQVTALDMAASGIDTRSIQDIRTLEEYSQPLLDFMKDLPPNKKVVLVGHSLGGMNISLAMEIYPQNVSVAVFLTAFMPDTVNTSSYTLERYLASTPSTRWLDSTFTTQDSPTGPQTILTFGAEFCKQKACQLSPFEDYELLLSLVRPSSLFLGDLSTGKKFTAERYETVKRVYIICEKDLCIPKDFQQWMITNYESTCSTVDTFVIQDADHTPVYSKPDDVVRCLLDAAHKYQ